MLQEVSTGFQDKRMLQWSFKWGSMVFKTSSMGVEGKFQRCFKDFSSKGVLREFQGSFKDVLRKCQVCFKKISKKFQGCFKIFP